MASLSEAVALDPNAKHLTFLAQAQKEAGDTRAAETTLRKAIADGRRLRLRIRGIDHFVGVGRARVRSGAGQTSGGSERRRRR